MHYPDFQTAIRKWEERKRRLESDPNKIGFMLTNWTNDESILERFDRLPFKHKVAFAHTRFSNLESVFMLKGYAKCIEKKKIINIFDTQKINGKRYIDQFDYVNFINQL